MFKKSGDQGHADTKEERRRIKDINIILYQSVVGNG